MGLPAALPHLNGARGSIARAAYFVLLAITLVHVAGSTWFNARDMFVNVPNTMAFGFKTYTESGGGPVVGELVSREAQAAGMVRTARFVSVDGWALPAGANEFMLADRLASDADGRVAIVTRDRSGVTRSHQLTRRSGVWTMREPRSGLPLWAYATLTLALIQLPLLFLLGASLLLALRRPRDPEAMLFATGFLLVCYLDSIAFWIKAIFHIGGNLFGMITDVGFGLLLIAITGFPDGRFTTRLARVTAALLVAVAVIGPFAWLRIERLLSILVWPLAGLALTAVWMRYRGSEESVRQQIKWAVLGFIAAVALTIVSNIGMMLGLLGAGHGPLRYLGWLVSGALGVILLPLGLLVSLLRYRLYDAEAAISRSAAYAALTVALLAIFAVSEKLIETVGEEYFAGSFGSVAGAAAAALAATMFAPLHHRLSRWAERRFQQGLVRLRRGVPALVGDLRETATPAAIAEAVAVRVESAVRARHVALLIGDAPAALRGVSAAALDQWRRGWVPTAALDCVRGDPLFPLRLPLTADGCGAVGWLLLGPRPDGSFYGKDEREALAEIADPVARALAIAGRRARDAAEADAVTSGLRARIVSLEAAVARLVGRPAATD